jgi:predicted RNA-binding Zn-ribbon protein involved in translation (DUF1610 family)
MCDWEYSDRDCPKCGNQLASRRCNQCEDGRVEYDDDEGRTAYDRCATCNGTGHEEWCRECGWDVTEGCFLSPKYEAEWLAKQEVP